jgi:Protein of unknown function (DUF2510)
MSNSTPPGWYPDPKLPAAQRYWDGNSWTDHVLPQEPAKEETHTAGPAAAPDGSSPGPGSAGRLTLPGQAEQPEPTERPDKGPAPPGTQWLTKWSGRKHKTKKVVLNAACQACGRKYQLNGKALNRYAELTSGWATFSYFLDSAGLWADNDKKGNAAKQLKYNREKAELEEKRLSAASAELACHCPNCRSDQVLVEAPK